MESRPPIVVVMGHVDHGKTTLLDYIRKTNIVSREAGGITQSIGAYEITHNSREITFIDTPGHEAFSKMRSGSAKVADLAILVVASDDGVKPQTIDALSCILDSKIPFVVAINKIDKPNSDIEKTKMDLNKSGVYLEGFGGNVSWHSISAKTGEGVDELLDLILLAADMENLNFNPDTAPKGIVITSRLDSRKGIIVGGIVTDGILKTGDEIRTVSASGKIKDLSNFLGEKINLAVAGTPVLIFGFGELPHVGEDFFVGDSSKVECEKIKKLSETKNEINKNGTNESDLTKSIKVILKSDESGSMEALKGVIQKLSSEIPIYEVSSGIGNIYESDVKTAESSHGIIIGFKVKTDKAAQNVARAKKIMVFESGVIYEVEKFLKLYYQKLSPKEIRSLEILAVFGTPRGKEKVVGGKIILGPVKNQESFEIWQDDKMIGLGRILNLQSKRVDVKEALSDEEVGLLVESEEPIKVGNRLIFSI